MTVEAKDAASIMLLRDAAGRGEGIEVLMVRRHARSDFAADMHVFPGGAVEECDCVDGMADLCAGLGPEDALGIIPDASSPARALGFFIAGIRETFEEAGLLLAQDRSGEPVSCAGERAAHFEALREKIKEGCLTFTEMLAAEGLKLAVDRLAYFAHWITPEISPIRFDTRFFLAPAPPCQDALHDDVETTAHLWISPREALERSERGDFPMLPPTIINLMALARFPTIGEAMSSPAGKEIDAILPRLSLEDGKLRLLLPDDLGRN